MTDTPKSEARDDIYAGDLPEHTHGGGVVNYKQGGTVKEPDFWITQTLVSYAIGAPVYRVSTEPPTEHDHRVAAAIYPLVNKADYDHLAQKLADLLAQAEKLAAALRTIKNGEINYGPQPHISEFKDEDIIATIDFDDAKEIAVTALAEFQKWKETK